MDRRSLSAQMRTLVGKKVKALRRQGLVPATLYGRDTKSLALTVPVGEFLPLFRRAGKTALIDLKVDGAVYPTLVKHVQAHPVNDRPLHVEFQKVNLKEKITADVPLAITGEAEAVKNGLGVLLTVSSQITVEALPGDLPDRITVDVGPLAQLEDQITVGQLAVPARVKVLTSPGTLVVKIAPLQKEEEPAPIPVAAGAPPSEGAVGEAPAEGKPAAAAS